MVACNTLPIFLSFAVLLYTNAYAQPAQDVPKHKNKKSKRLESIRQSDTIPIPFEYLIEYNNPLWRGLECIGVDPDNPRRPAHIRTKEELERVIKANSYTLELCCPNGLDLDGIDFEKYDLIGQFTSILNTYSVMDKVKSPEKLEFSTARYFYKIQSTQKYYYEIIFTQNIEEVTKLAHVTYNWILVPKLPNNQTVLCKSYLIPYQSK